MKNSMFGFLFSKDGKSRQERKGKSHNAHSSMEEKLKKLTDAKLSSDSRGSRIQELWNQSKIFCSSSLESRCSERFNREDQINFEMFISQVIIEYEEVIVKSQLNNPLVPTGVDGPPASINDTWGLPTDMVIAMTNFFLSYICIGSAELPKVVTFPNDVSETLLMFDTLEFSFSHVLDSIDDLSETSDWIMISRYNFLLAANAMSTICSWPHNRNVISHHFGHGFSRLFVQIIRSLVAKLEDVIIACGENENGPIFCEGSALEEDAFFLLHALLGLVRTLARSVPSLDTVTKKCQTRILPQQPWLGNDLSLLGFCDISNLTDIVGEYSRRDEEAEKKSKRDSVSSFTFFGRTGRSSSLSALEDLNSSSPYPNSSSIDDWTLSLIKSGAVQILISLLTKLAYLSRTLASSPHYVPILEPSIEKNNDGGGCRRMTVCWSHCVTLQCEVMFVLLSYLDFRPKKVRSKFNLCNGAGIMNSLFSMRDSPPQDKIGDSDFYLGYHRGLLCLNVIKEIVRSSSGSDEVDRDESIKDCLLALESLPLFMAWLESYIISHNLIHASSLSSPNLLRNIILQASTAHNIAVPIPVSELWPWEYSKAEMFAAMFSNDHNKEDNFGGKRSGNGQGHANDDDEVVEGSFVDVDLLSHGNVMLRYAETSTLMEKYIKSMQQNSSFSLNSAVIDVFEGPSVSSSAVTPWFMTGPVAIIWDHFFDSLITLCQATHSQRDFTTATSYDQDSKGNVFLVDQKMKSKDLHARNAFFCSIFSSIVTSLRVCADAQASASSSKSPMFQFHMVHFIGLSLHFFPEETLSVCRTQKLWSILASSKSFLLGGSDVIRKLFRLAATHTAGGLSWSLHEENDDDEDEKGGTNRSNSMSNEFRPSLADLDLLSKEETLFEADETSSNSDDDSYYDGGTHGTHSRSAEDGTDNNPDKLDSSFSDGSPAIGGVYGTPEIPYFSRFDSTDMRLGESFEAGQQEGYAEVFGGEEVLSAETRVEAFAWLTLFDSVFQLMSMAVAAVERAGNVLAKEEIKSSSRQQGGRSTQQQASTKNTLPGSTTELYSMLQSIGRDTPDHVVLQTMLWIKCILRNEHHLHMSQKSTPGNSGAGISSEKYKHILFKCLSLCKFQLLSSCDSSTNKAITVIDDDNCPPFWIGDEIAGIHKKRPFLWPARASVIELIVTIIKISPGFVWSKAFLPKSDPSAAPGPSPLTDRMSRVTVHSSSYNTSGETNLTPKHVTLLLLLLDPRCRDVSLYILTELLHACACLNYNIAGNGRDTVSSHQNNKSTPPPNKAHLSVSNPTDSDISKSIFAAIFHDIIKCLFVYHIKYSMLQPTWCNGCGIVSSICRWMRSFLGNPDRSSYLPYYQSMFLSYGQLGPHHYLLNWIKPRPHIFRELFLSVDQCIKKSSVKDCWSVDMKINALRHFLSMLTGLMIDSGVTKHKFSILMLLKKYSKNKAKVVSNPNSGLHVGIGVSSTCNFHDVAGMVIALEKSPSLETILILFDMLLDGPKQDNAELVASGVIPEDGMFSDEESDVCMSNMVIIPIILLLIPSCSLPLQKCILLTLQNLLTGRFSLVNLSKCCDMQPPVLDSLLDLFLQLKEEVRPLCLDLLQVIGMHNISVAQLKRIFRLMHVQSDYRPAYTSMLLRCMRGMVSTVKCPKHFFLFEGSPRSGLQIPSIARWPATTCYSFCFWFCVRSPSKMFATSSADVQSPRLHSFAGLKSASFSFNASSNSFSSVYRPTLLSFRQENGLGFEVYLKVNSSRKHTYSLVFESYKDAAEKVESSVVMIDHIIETSPDMKKKLSIRGDEWYFLAFSHCAATFRSKSELSVMLNGHFSKHVLSFPRFSGEIKKPLMGNTSGDFPEFGLVTSLTGQMGSIYMFSDWFSELQMQKLYAIGLNISMGLDNHVNATLDAISTNILLAYNPGIWNGNYFLNMAPAKNAKFWGASSASASSSPTSTPGRRGSKSLPNGLEISGSGSGKMHANMLPGTFRCTFCDMRDALDCLGGGRVLIPLFAQFDLPILEQDGSINYSVDSSLALEVVKLLFLLRRDSGQGKSFLKYAGFQLISFFLERISPRHLTLELLNVFIVNADMLYADREWYDGVVKYILLDFKLWMFASYEVQYHLFIHLLGLSETETSVMREVLTIRELFDALYVIYCKTPPLQGMSKGEQSGLDPEGNESGIHKEGDDEDEEDNLDEERDDEEEARCSVLLPKKCPTTPKSLLVTQLFFHEVTGDIVGKRLDGKELDEVRRLIFCIIFALVSGEKRGNDSPKMQANMHDKKSAAFQYPTEEEIQCIMYYISHEKEDICKIQGLQLLIDLLDVPHIKLQKQILSAMSVGVKVYPLLGLVLNKNPKIRFYAFLALCNIIQMATVYGKLPDFEFAKKKLAATNKAAGIAASANGRAPVERSGSSFSEGETVSNSSSWKDSLDEEDKLESPANNGEGIGSPTISGKTALSPSGSSPRPSSMSVSAGMTPPILKTPRQNSFSFIPPSLSATLRKRSDLFADGAVAQKDTFSDIGIPVDTLRYVILWAQNNLLEVEGMDSKLIEAECEIIITIMTRTMTGKRSTFLMSEIDEIFNSNGKAGNNIKSPKSRKMSYSSIRTSTGAFKNENLLECVFCVPAFVPVLLNFISRDVVPYSLRFSTLVLLKTKLQSFENCDLFLQIPQWQTSMFELLMNEQKRIYNLQMLTTRDDAVLGSPVCGSGSIFKSMRDVEKELDRSTGILQTGLRMLCDLFLYGVEYGCPSSENIICRPADESMYTVPKPTPISMIQAIGRGERKLGVKILKETMSYLRCYAERGDLDIDLIGMSLLQQIVNCLNLRNDSWNSDTTELAHHRHIKIRVFNSACWLTTFFIVEFLTLPVVQSYSKFHFKLDRNLAGSEQNCFPETPTRPTSGVDNAQIDEIKQKLFDDNFIPESTESSSDDDVIVDTGGISIDIENSNFHQSRARTSSFGSSVPPSVARARSTSPVHAMQDDGETDSFWGLFGSLLSLLESLNPNVARKGATGIKIALAAGLRNSQNILHQMNETMEDAIGSQSAEDDVNVERTITGSVIPVHKLASQISWRIVRVVCNIFFECGQSRQLLSRSSQKSQVEAIGYIQRTLVNLEKVDRKSFEFESLHTIVKLVEVLRQTLHKPHDDWVIAAFKLLKTIIQKNKHLLIRKFTARSGSLGSLTEEDAALGGGVGSNRNSNNADDDNVVSGVDASNTRRRASSASLTQEETSSETASYSSNNSSNSTKQKFNAMIFSFEDEHRPSHNHQSFSSSMSDYTLTQINGAMGVKDWKDASSESVVTGPDYEFGVQVTWKLWEESLQSVVTKGVEMEDTALTSSLTELGMHKQTEQIEQLLSNAQSSETNYFSMLSTRSESFMKKATEHEMNSLQRLLRTSAVMNKRNAARWNTILEELANERGPWGVGAEECVETYWTFDMREDYMRRRFKMRRNAKGSNHPMATFFLNPPNNFVSNDVEGSGDGTASDSVALSTTSASVSSTSILQGAEGDAPSSQYAKTMSAGLWKDLFKYQTNTIDQPVDRGANQQDEDDDEQEDEFSLGDEFAFTSSDHATGTGIPDSTMISGNNFVIDAIIQDKVLFAAETCDIITPSTNSMNPPAYGTLEITSSKITFTKKGPDPPKPSTMLIDDIVYENHDHLWACESFPSTTWSTDEIVNIWRRNFHLRNTAIELFLSSRKSVFINLHNKNSAFRFFFVIRNIVKPPYLAPFLGMRPAKMVMKMTPPGSSTNITLAWQTREISNFEYLMHLNTIAGRSFNDLGQYPVFPWILADYTSNVLRLREASTYRDLQWPMGAQNLNQREMMHMKYDDINTMFVQSQNSEVDMGPSMPPFHYGSHYSTAGFVMWYLMRSEPFTSLHIQLQDGKFDRSDRLFDSIDAAWKGCIHNASDVKELVPEFFYCPEIFENVNNLGLGVKSSTRKKIGDIVLPPWAADPLEFVRLNRKALESEYVSKNLHHWIDLIFGYKQRPPHLSSGGSEATVDACNVFFHLTYAGAVDLDELLEKDKSLYKQYVNQIAEFGQTPTQLFTEPHVPRQSIENADIAWPIASVVLGADTIMKGDVLPDKPKKIICFKSYKVSAWPILLIALATDKLVTVDSSRVLGNHFWQSLPPDVVPPYRFKVDAIAYELSHGLASSSGSTLSSMMPSYSTVSSVKDKRIGVPFLNQVLISQPSLTTQEADDEYAKTEPMHKKDFLRAEKETKKIGVLNALSLPHGRSSRSNTDLQSIQSTDSMSTDDLSDVPAVVSAYAKKQNSSPKRNSPYNPSNRKRAALSANSNTQAPHNPPRVFQKRRAQARAIDDHLSSQLFAVHPNSRLLFSCGYWDHSFKVTVTETGKLLQSINQHKDAVTCLTLATNYGQTWLVTGSRDCTLMVWDVNNRDSDHPIGSAPLHILYGHDDAVTSVSVSADLDIVVSGSDDGTVILHGLRDGSYIRSILVGIPTSVRTPSSSSLQQPEDVDERGGAGSATASSSSRRRINWVCITPESYVVVYLVDEHLLCTYTMNGRVVASKDIRERLYAFVLSDDGQVILTGGENCLVIFRWVHSLELANDGPRKGLEAVLDGMVEETEGTQQPISSPIRSLFLSKQERHLIVGTDRGDIRVFAQDSDYLRQRLQRKLEEIGIL